MTVASNDLKAILNTGPTAVRSHEFHSTEIRENKLSINGEEAGLGEIEPDHLIKAAWSKQGGEHKHAQINTENNKDREDLKKLLPFQNKLIVIRFIAFHRAFGRSELNALAVRHGRETSTANSSSVEMARELR